MRPWHILQWRVRACACARTYAVTEFTEGWTGGKVYKGILWSCQQGVAQCIFCYSYDVGFKDCG